MGAAAATPALWWVRVVGASGRRKGGWRPGPCGQVQAVLLSWPVGRSQRGQNDQRDSSGRRCRQRSQGARPREGHGFWPSVRRCVGRPHKERLLCPSPRGGALFRPPDAAVAQGCLSWGLPVLGAVPGALLPGGALSPPRKSRPQHCRGQWVFLLPHRWGRRPSERLGHQDTQHTCVRQQAVNPTRLAPGGSAVPRPWAPGTAAPPWPAEVSPVCLQALNGRVQRAEQPPPGQRPGHRQVRPFAGSLGPFSGGPWRCRVGSSHTGWRWGAGAWPWGGEGVGPRGRAPTKGLSYALLGLPVAATTSTSCCGTLGTWGGPSQMCPCGAACGGSSGTRGAGTCCWQPACTAASGSSTAGRPSVSGAGAAGGGSPFPGPLLHPRLPPHCRQRLRSATLWACGRGCPRRLGSEPRGPSARPVLDLGLQGAFCGR